MKMKTVYHKCLVHSSLMNIHRNFAARLSDDDRVSVSLTYSINKYENGDRCGDSWTAFQRSFPFDSVISKPLTYSNHFCNKCFPHDRRARSVRRAHSRKCSTASTLSATSYRWRINRSDPEHAKRRKSRMRR